MITQVPKVNFILPNNLQAQFRSYQSPILSPDFLAKNKVTTERPQIKKSSDQDLSMNTFKLLLMSVYSYTSNTQTADCAKTSQSKSITVKGYTFYLAFLGAKEQPNDQETIAEIMQNLNFDDSTIQDRKIEEIEIRLDGDFGNITKSSVFGDGFNASEIFSSSETKAELEPFKVLKSHLIFSRIISPNYQKNEKLRNAVYQRRN